MPRARSADVAAAVELVARQVVPPAVDAHLDHVPGELLVGRLELLELGRGADAAPVRAPERVAVDIGDEPEVRAPADRAVAPGRFTDVTTGPHELGMRVADVEAVEAAGPQIAQHRAPGKRVVDVPPHGGECRTPADPPRTAPA